MKITAVIAEYNPFHLGHLYHIEKAKNETAPDIMVVVMSGSFTERGDFTVASKFERAAHAVKAGADVVLELPTVFALSPAQDFAYGAIKIISAFFNHPAFLKSGMFLQNSIILSDLKNSDKLPILPNLYDKVSYSHDNHRVTLSFGSEAGDLEILDSIVKLSENEPQELQNLIKENLKKGHTYPRAKGEAFNVLYPDLADALKKPNNILAIEYIRAAKALGDKISFHTVTREDNFNDTEVKGNFASASAIREMLKNGDDYKPFVPPYVTLSPRNFTPIENALLENIRKMTKDELSAVSEVIEGLENRMKRLENASTYEEFLFAVKTKRYTMARLKRIGISAYLGITETAKQRAKSAAPYASVLALNETRREEIFAALTNCFGQENESGIFFGSENKIAYEMIKFDNAAYDMYNKLN